MLLDDWMIRGATNKDGRRHEIAKLSNSSHVRCTFLLVFFTSSLYVCDYCVLCLLLFPMWYPSKLPLYFQFYFINATGALNLLFNLEVVFSIFKNLAGKKTTKNNNSVSCEKGLWKVGKAEKTMCYNRQPLKYTVHCFLIIIYTRLQHFSLLLLIHMNEFC